LLEAIIIGLVEGLTEFLPISSTGHLLIVQNFYGLRSDAFNVLIQVGPIVASVLVFWRDILKFFTDWKNPAQKDYVIKLMASFFITCVGGLIAKKIFKLELPKEVLPVALAVLIGAFVIFAIEIKVKKKTLNSNLTWGIVVAVAAGQILAAVFPGASRSGMAVMGALLLGFARPAAVKFAFLVGIPTMFAAGGFELFNEIKDGKAHDLFSPENIVAYVVATISAWLSVVWLLKFVQTRNFIPFAWYRVVLGIVLLAMLIFKTA